MEIKSLAGRIRAKVIEVLSVIKRILTTAGLMKAVLEKEDAGEAVSFILDRLRSVFRAFRPKKGSRIYAALDDPYDEGRLTSVMAFLYPFYGNRIDFEPDFSSDTTVVTVSLSGKIRLFTIVLAAVRLILNQKVRQLYQDMKSLITTGGADGESK